MHHAETSYGDLGSDPWTYGVEENRAVPEAMLRYAEADELTATRLTPESLFD